MPFADFCDVNSLITAGFKLPTICGAGNWCTELDLPSCMKQLQLPPPIPSTTTYILKYPSVCVCVWLSICELVSQLNWLECHIFLASAGAKQTHYLPINLFLYSQFIKVALHRSEWPRLGKVYWLWTTVWLCLLSNHMPVNGDGVFPSREGMSLLNHHLMWFLLGQE